ncbi:MAG: hypothetical protein KC516_02495 [Nanoarchaeota archaeon]|nr:hypothetical protein [Nanoarchaeota archaeon]
MKSINLLLNDAESEWRNEISRDFPLRADTPVIRQYSQNGRDWQFSTDLNKIYADISNDKNIQEKFEKVITKYWEGNPEELAKETLHYLLFHELYHPVEAPFSVVGKSNDNKKIHQAIRRGVLKAEPNLSALDQVKKVQASQNGVKDFILDNRFALDNKKKGYVREDIIPTWDVLELEKSEPVANFYTATRFLYGLMYGPERIHEFFEEKTGNKGVEIAEKALGTLIKEKVTLPKQKNLTNKVKSFLGSSNESNGNIQKYIQKVREVFSGEDRYLGIERFMSILGPYVTSETPQGRPDMQGEGNGGSPQNILQDLLDDMTPEEQEEFAQDLSESKPSQLEDAVLGMAKPYGEGTEKGEIRSCEEQMKNLDLLATHEYYKRNHPKIKITGGNKSGEIAVIGKQEYWDLKRSTILTEDQLSKVNIGKINKLQRKTKLPWLIDLGNNTFRLNEYELKNRDLKDVVYIDQKIDVPEITEFYLDSSGSMFSSDFKVNDGSRFDMLTSSFYGFVDALKQGSQELKKPTSIRIHNVGDKQISSEIISIDKFWNGDIESLRTLFKPENGYSEEDLNITNFNDGKKRAYIVATDGNLVISGRTQRESAKMKEIARNKNNHVALFEIGSTYSLGNAVKSDANINYNQVHDKNKLFESGLEVLLSK